VKQADGLRAHLDYVVLAASHRPKPLVNGRRKSLSDLPGLALGAVELDIDIRAAALEELRVRDRGLFFQQAGRTAREIRRDQRHVFRHAQRVRRIVKQESHPIIGTSKMEKPHDRIDLAGRCAQGVYLADSANLAAIHGQIHTGFPVADRGRFHLSESFEGNLRELIGEESEVIFRCWFASVERGNRRRRVSMRSAKDDLLRGNTVAAELRCDPLTHRRVDGENVSGNPDRRMLRAAKSERAGEQTIDNLVCITWWVSR